MSILMWGVAAVVGGLLVILLGARALGRSHDAPPLDEPLPPTPLQGIARRGLWIGGALTAALVVWMIGLQERFWDTGFVPVYYLQLVFWSCLVVSLLAFPLGILVGYRRS